MAYYEVMKDAITDYQQWKLQGKDLRAKAKQAMETRFRELLTEAVHLAEEYKADFGGSLSPPAIVTGFRYKAGSRRVAPKPVAKANPKLTRMQKSLEAMRKKLDDAKAKGGPTKNLEDRIYEIEDSIRLTVEK